METYVFAFLIVCTAVTLSEACDNGWVPFGSSCYKYFTDRKTWSQAKTYCESQKSHLTIVMSTEENNFLKAELRKHHLDKLDQVWMDGDDLKVEGSFVWANTGEEFEITDWGPNEPNQNGGNEHCLTFFAHYNFQWNDEHCDSTFGFLCEKESSQIIG
ncbi:lectin-like [Ruditapes philippinarum]|uniref:lectin-like n=1 Tax=Ruditapes philippinarum TaxID=129788 RepID=UPI00295BE059|nr:lectin-like [Ruditapes philippinarum]